MPISVPHHFLTNPETALLQDIKDGRLAYLEFQNGEFSIVFDLMRRMTVGAYRHKTIPFALNYAERSRLTYSVGRMLDDRIHCFDGLKECGKCGKFSFGNCRC